jgi:hypothetical protein
LHKIEILRYSSDYASTWDHVVTNSKNGNFLHFRRYMDYHKHRFADQSVLVFSGGRVVAVLPCNKIDTTIVSHGGLTYGGLLYGRESHVTDVLDVFSEIRKYFTAMGCDRLVYKAVPRVFQRYPADEDIYALYRYGAKLVRRDLSSVVEIAARPKFSDSRKNTVRKAEKAGCIFVELNKFTEFYELLASVLARFGVVPVHTEAELLLLKTRFPAHIRLFGATLDGVLVAGVLIYDFGHIVHSQYMASSVVGKSVGALDFVLAQLIQTICADKKYFSFGISTEQDGHYLNDGLVRQKEGFGGRGVVHDFYEWSLRNDTLA